MEAFVLPILWFLFRYLKKEGEIVAAAKKSGKGAPIKAPTPPTKKAVGKKPKTPTPVPAEKPTEKPTEKPAFVSADMRAFVALTEALRALTVRVDVLESARIAPTTPQGLKVGQEAWALWTQSKDEEADPNGPLPCTIVSIRRTTVLVRWNDESESEVLHSHVYASEKAAVAGFADWLLRARKRAQQSSRPRGRSLPEGEIPQSLEVGDLVVYSREWWRVSAIDSESDVLSTVPFKGDGEGPLFAGESLTFRSLSRNGCPIWDVSE